MITVPRANPLAPDWMQPGIHETPPGYVDEYREYSLLKDLTIAQVSRENAINVYGPGCFIWMATAVQVGVPVTSNSPYIQIKDHLGRFMMNEPVRATSWAGPGEYAMYHMPVVVVPQSGQILVDFYEVDGVNIHISLVLRGIERRLM